MNIRGGRASISKLSVGGPNLPTRPGCGLCGKKPFELHRGDRATTTAHQGGEAFVLKDNDSGSSL
jgi:hypothetical protein